MRGNSMIRTTAAVALAIATMFALPAAAQTTAHPGDPKPATNECGCCRQQDHPVG